MQLGRRVRDDRQASAGSRKSAPGGILHIRPHTQRSGVSLLDIRREFGTNNFPDCSNMCHEPTSRGLPPPIGVGKGTVILDDFEHAEAIFVIGQNTGTNSPRMMSNLVEASKRGVPIVAVNPMPERALVRFADPQDVIQMATFGSTRIASEFVHVRIGGDLAFLKGVMKVMFEREEAGEKIVDWEFIREHTVGLDAVRSDALAQTWPDLERGVRVRGSATRRCAEICIRSRATIICYGMGITQHQEGRGWCSSWSICSCSKVISASRAPEFHPSVVIPMCREIAPSGSMSSRARTISIAFAMFLASRTSARAWSSYH